LADDQSHVSRIGHLREDHGPQHGEEKRPKHQGDLRQEHDKIREEADKICYLIMEEEEWLGRTRISMERIG
jgi:hypothetical protein